MKFLGDDEIIFYPKAPDKEEKLGNETCSPSDADILTMHRRERRRKLQYTIDDLDKIDIRAFI